MHWNQMNDDESGSIKLLKLKYRRGDHIIQTFCKIGSPQKLLSPSSGDSEKKTPKSYKMHWNLMNDEEFGSIKFSKSKYWRGDKIIIQTFCRIGPPLLEIRSPLFNV